jgi:two-component system chemotaxis response regulator CheY
VDTSFAALVVEDSPVLRTLIAGAVARLPGAEVVTAENGIDALKKVQTQAFSIVVTDINMPIMDGLKLIHRIRQDPAYKDVPILVISTESSEEDQRKAMSLGATRFVSKPVTGPDVERNVRELLGRSE